jgi:photosystem II PsbY protein
MRVIYISLREEAKMDFDWRILAVISPVLLAAGWATFNIGAAAIRQLQSFWNKEA